MELRARQDTASYDYFVYQKLLSGTDGRGRIRRFGLRRLHPPCVTISLRDFVDSGGGCVATRDRGRRGVGSLGGRRSCAERSDAGGPLEGSGGEDRKSVV